MWKKYVDYLLSHPTKEGAQHVIDLLRSAKQLQLLPSIVSEYKRRHAYQDKQEVLTVAHTDDVAWAKKDAGVKEDVRVEIDESLISGYRYKSEKRAIEYTGKTALVRLYQIIITSL